MSVTQQYFLHGLQVRSEVPLAAQTTMPDAATSSADPVLAVVLGDRATIPHHAPAGELLAIAEEHPEGFALTKSAEGYRMRFYGLCDFHFAPNTMSLTVHLAHGVSAEYATLFLSSNVLSCVLALSGVSVIHASAVLSGDQRAFALIGPSGSGKSTLAAALCAEGLRLLTDDALRCDFSNSERKPSCSTGTLELRLRANSGALAPLFGQPATASTVDSRIPIRAPQPLLSRYSLSYLVAPRLGPTLKIEQLHGRAALTAMLKAARITYWRSPNIAAQQFAQLAELSRAVPVYALSTPLEIASSASGRRALRETLEGLN